MGARQKDNEFNGQPFPGTGGDFVDGNDVEGHRRGPYKVGEEARQRDGEESARRWPGGEDLDVEGHRRGPNMLVEEGGEDLYRNLPTAQGESVRRGPGDNPHGDR